MGLQGADAYAPVYYGALLGVPIPVWVFGVPPLICKVPPDASSLPTPEMSPPSVPPVIPPGKVK